MWTARALLQLALFGLLLPCLGQDVQVAGPDRTELEGILTEADKLSRSDDIVAKFALLQQALMLRPEDQDPALLVNLYEQIRSTLSDLEDYEQAVTYARKCIETAQQAGLPTSVQPIAPLTGALGSMFLFKGQLDSAAFHFHRARVQATAEKGLWYPSALNNLGILHLRAHALDSAIWYFEAARMATTEQGPMARLLHVSIRDNLSDVASARGDGPAAIRIVRENLDSLRAIGLDERGVRAKFMTYRFKLIDLLLANDLRTEAAAELAETRLLIKALGQWLDPTRRMDLAERELAMARVSGDARATAQQALRLLAMKDSAAAVRQARHALVEGALTRLSMAQMERSMSDRLRLSEAHAHAADLRARSRARFALLIGAAAVIVITLIVLLLRARIRRKQAEKDLVEFELEHKRRDVQHLAMEITRRKERAGRLAEAADAIAKAPPAELHRQLAQLKANAASEVRVEEHRAWMNEEIETVNSAFYQKLQERYPTLTRTELELCGLVRSGFSNKEIAEVRNITPKSARMARFRLKQKLDLTADQDLEQVIREL